MKLTREEMMIKAVAAMTEMRIIPSYISALKRKKNSTKTMFIRYGGYYIDENTEDNLLAKIKEIETEHGGLVYAVIKNSIEEQTVYSFCTSVIIKKITIIITLSKMYGQKTVCPLWKFLPMPGLLMMNMTVNSVTFISQVPGAV